MLGVFRHFIGFARRACNGVWRVIDETTKNAGDSRSRRTPPKKKKIAQRRSHGLLVFFPSFFYLPRAARWCCQCLICRLQPSGRVFFRVPGFTRSTSLLGWSLIFVDFQIERTVALVLVRGLRTGYSQWPPGQPRTPLPLLFSPPPNGLSLPPLLLPPSPRRRFFALPTLPSSLQRCNARSITRFSRLPTLRDELILANENGNWIEGLCVFF